jgi:uncharacterized membrane protein YfcA
LLGATLAAAFVVGFLKTSVSAGTGLVLTSTLSLVLPAPVVLGLISPLMLMSDPIAMRFYWRRWDARQVRLLVPATTLGLLAGTWALTLLSESWLRRTIGLIALALALLQLAVIGRARPLFGERPHWLVGVAVGMVTGVASMVAHSGGVVSALYLLGAGLSTAALIATVTAVYATTNIVKVVLYWKIGFLTPYVLLVDLLAAPVVLLGAWLGYRLNRVLPRRAFELALLIIAIAGALRLLLT